MGFRRVYESYVRLELMNSVTPVGWPLKTFANKIRLDI